MAVAEKAVRDVLSDCAWAAVAWPGVESETDPVVAVAGPDQ
jgi:hypothetical protein